MKRELRLRAIAGKISLRVLLLVLMTVAGALFWSAGGHPKSTFATHAMPCADLDGDKGVTPVDVSIDVSYYFTDDADGNPGLPPYTPGYEPASDMNGDGQIRPNDFLTVNAALGTYTLCQDTPLTWKSGTPPPPGSGDFDGDGCPDAMEQQVAAGSEISGGLRDYLNPWDYFNPSGDGQNRIFDDVNDVRNQYFVDFPQAGYTMVTDRTRDVSAPNAWNTGPPDGQQRVDDIIYIVQQYFHDCS